MPTLLDYLVVPRGLTNFAVKSRQDKSSILKQKILSFHHSNLAQFKATAKDICITITNKTHITPALRGNYVFTHTIVILRFPETLLTAEIKPIFGAFDSKIRHLFKSDPDAEFMTVQVMALHE